MCDHTTDGCRYERWIAEMKAASAEFFYAFSVCLLSAFAIRAALLVIHDIPLRGDSRQIDCGSGLPVLEYPNEALDRKRA